MSRRTVPPRRLVAALVAMALSIALLPVPASALTAAHATDDGIGTPTEFATWTYPYGPAVDDRYGNACAVNGAWAVVGAQGRGEGTADYAGMASFYRWLPSGGWGFGGVLPVNDPHGWEFTGGAVAASRDQMFVGARGKYVAGKMRGLVYVYDEDDSVGIDQTLTVDPAGEEGLFGAAIAVDGDTLVVSAANASVGATSSGAVFVFRRGVDGWAQTQRLDAPSPLAGQVFGYSVALSGDDLVVGSPYYGTDSQGRVYTYRRDASGTWIYGGEHMLVPAADDDLYGYSVAVSNGLMAATAPGRDGTEPNSGIVYVSRWSGAGWQTIADQESPAPTPGQAFGSRVALAADTMLITADTDAGYGGAQTGVVYQYVVDPVPLLPPTYKRALYSTSIGTPPSHDAFGDGLGFDGDTLFAGSPNYSTSTTANAGAITFIGGLRTARCRVDSTLAAPSPGVLGNDWSTLGAVSASLIAQPAHGAATVTTDGAWTYDPTSWFVGTDTFRYMLTSDTETRTATVTVQVYPPATKVGTSITIKRSASSVRRYRTLKLSGRLSPGGLGDHCVVYVKKPGSHTWKLLTTRHAYSITPNAGANWSYSLKPKSRGRYYFKVRFPGDANRNADWSPYLSVRVR